MSAEIKLIKTCGQSGYETETEVTTPALKSVDDATTAPADAPVKIPASGTNYSFESWLRFKCTVAPANQLTNFKLWSDGADPATGVSDTVNTDAVSSYSEPKDSQSVAGTRDNFKNKDSANKISLGGTLVNVADKTDFMVFQEEVINQAAPGSVSFNVNYSYDES